MSDGQIEITGIAESGNAALKNVVDRAEEETAAIRAQMSPPGALGLPALLEQRRLEYGMIDGYFKKAALFDRVYVYQIPLFKSKTFDPSGKILMPDSAAQRESHECPEGIIVGAGLLALDHLRSNGADLGHRIGFLRNAPWRVRVGMVLGKPVWVLPMTAGDLIGSEELADNLRTRACRVIHDKDKNQHLLIDGDGKTWAPTSAWKEGDY